MTERKKLKRELSKMKSYRKNLPRLIDCSDVYGDCFFNQADIQRANIRILELESLIKEIDEKSTITL